MDRGVFLSFLFIITVFAGCSTPSRELSTPTSLPIATNAWPLGQMKALLETLADIDRTVKRGDYLEAAYGLGVPNTES